MKKSPLPFRILLRLLPASFREEHGEEICELAHAYARDRSFFGKVLVWIRASGDLLMVAGRVRLGRQGDHKPAQRWDETLRDARHALRGLRRDPGFSFFAVLIVGLGIGACVTVFSVVEALLLRPLPFHEPERLVWVSNGEFGRGQQLSEITTQVGHVVKVREGATQLTDIAGYHLFDREGDHTLAASDEPVRVTRLRVTENLLNVLGVEPALGRSFSPEEAWDNGPTAILLTHRSWSNLFGRDPAVVGTTVALDEAPATIIGVLPESFDFVSIFAPGTRVDYLAPFPLSPRSHRTGNTLGLVGRLAPEATVESAQAELDAFAVTEGQTVERENAFDPVVRPLRDHISGGFRPAMALLLGSVVLVLVMVCANLSNLLIARGSAREQEMAVRAALGAGRGRLIRQLLTETLLLAGLGAALGVALAVLGTKGIAGLDLRIPLLSGTRVDLVALGIALAAATGAGLLFGVVPALKSSRFELTRSLKTGARGSSSGKGQASLRRGLVVTQIAIAYLLLTTSFLTARSLFLLTGTDLGYQVENVVSLRVDPAIRFETNEERLDYYGAVLDRMKSTPGVEAAGLSDILPMAFNRRWSARSPEADPEHRVSSFVRVVSPGYLDAMGLTLLTGRDFNSADVPSETRAVLVSPVFATRMWGQSDPLGKIIRTSGRDYRVIGVVAPTRQLSVDQEAGPEMFFSYTQLGDMNAVHLILRGTQLPADLIQSARSELQALAPNVAVDQAVHLENIVRSSLAPRRFLATLLGGFAVFALVLAALGIYAVLAYSVGQRKREIGVHIALGATSGDVQRRMGRETVGLTGLGLGLGLLGAGLASQIVERVLVGVASLDPLTYFGAAIALGSIALVSGWIPTRSASRTNPLEALSGSG